MLENEGGVTLSPYLQPADNPGHVQPTQGILWLLSRLVISHQILQSLAGNFKSNAIKFTILRVTLALGKEKKETGKNLLWISYGKKTL